MTLEPQDQSSPTIPMDTVINLMADERECKKMIDWWTKRQKLIKERLAQIMGENTVGTVNGIPAIYYERVNQFNSSAFQKQYPDMYRLYSRPMTETRFDPEMLRASRPDLYAEFQVRKMRNVYEAPGSPDLPEMPERQF